MGGDGGDNSKASTPTDGDIDKYNQSETTTPSFNTTVASNNNTRIEVE